MEQNEQKPRGGPLYLLVGIACSIVSAFCAVPIWFMGVGIGGGTQLDILMLSAISTTVFLGVSLFLIGFYGLKSAAIFTVVAFTVFTVIAPASLLFAPSLAAAFASAHFLLKARQRRALQVLAASAAIGICILVFATFPPTSPPLHQAAGGSGESLSEVERLIAGGADVNAFDAQGNTPLHIASGKNTLVIVNALIEAGADVNVRNVDGDTALHLASSYRASPAVANALIEAGADVNVRNVGGDTALHASSSFGKSPAVIHALIDAGADVNARDKFGNTPLHDAATHSDMVEILLALIEEGADVQAIDNFGATPLHDVFNDVFSSGAKLAKANALLESGANVNARDNSGETPLHEAAHGSEDPRQITALLAAGADVNASSKHGRTPLHMAVWFNEEPGIVAALIEAGSEIDAVDQHGDTVLHYFAKRTVHSWEDEEEKGQKAKEIFDALLAAGANLSATNLDGKTALEVAQFNEAPKSLLDILSSRHK